MLHATPLESRAFVACENIRFSSLFATGAKSEEKRMFSQASAFAARFCKSVPAIVNK